MTALWIWFCVPTHYAPLAGLAYSGVEWLLGKTSHGSTWGAIGGFLASFLQKKSEDK